MERFLARSESLECGGTGGLKVPVFVGVNKQLGAVGFVAMRELPGYFPNYITGAGGCWPTLHIPACTLVWYHHILYRYFDRTFWLGTCGAQKKKQNGEHYL